MPITAENPLKGRPYPGEVILRAVRWYLRYPLAYEHVAELLAERGLSADRSCVWPWVQAYAPEINKRCRPHLKPTNKSYRSTKLILKKARKSICTARSIPPGRRSIFCSPRNTTKVLK